MRFGTHKSTKTINLQKQHITTIEVTSSPVHSTVTINLKVDGTEVYHSEIDMNTLGSSGTVLHEFFIEDKKFLLAAGLKSNNEVEVGILQKT